MLSKFWRLSGWGWWWGDGGLGESSKTEKLVMKISFSDNIK